MDTQTPPITGYSLYWKRIARHLSISQLARQLGVKATDLSAFEQGNDHPLTPDQIAAYAALLDAIPVDEAPDPEPGA